MFAGPIGGVVFGAVGDTQHHQPDDLLDPSTALDPMVVVATPPPSKCSLEPSGVSNGEGGGGWPPPALSC